MKRTKNSIKAGMVMTGDLHQAFVGGVDEIPTHVTKDMHADMAEQRKQQDDYALRRWIEDNRGKNLITGKPY